MLRHIIILGIIAPLFAKNKGNMDWKIHFEAERTYTCNPEIIKRFVPTYNADEHESTPATHEMLEICPKLRQTCCDMQTLNGLKESFEKGKKSIMQWKNLHQAVYKTFKHKKVVLNNLKKNPETKNALEGCLTEDENKNIKKYIDNVDYSEHEMREVLRQLVNGFSRYFSGIGCEICSGRANRSFDIEYGNDWVYKIHTDSIYELLFNFQLINEYKNYLIDVFNISKVAKCVLDNNSDGFVAPFIRNDLSNEAKIISGCISKSPQQLLDDQNCRDLVSENSLSIFNGLEDAYDIMKRAKETIERLEGGLSKIEPNVNDKIRTSIFYITYDEGESINFKFMKLELDTVDGLRPVDNEMKIDIWKHTSILNKIVLVLVGLLMTK